MSSKMSEDQIAKPANAKELVSPDRADDAPVPAHIEARESFQQEASVTQQATSFEIAQSINTTQTENANFVVDMDMRSLTEHSVSFGDGAKVDYSNNLPQELQNEGGSTKFDWQGGKLNGIELPDGSKWQFQNGKWQHSDQEGKPDATAEGLRFETGSKPGLITGQITEATIRRMNGGYLAPPELQNEPLIPVTERVAETIEAKPGDRPAVKPDATSMSPETLSAAVQSVRQNLNDPQKVDATLRAIPSENKQQFEKLYNETTKTDLRRELKARKMDAAISLLNPQEEARQAGWLQGNLTSLSRLGSESTERALVEHNIRLNLRGMSDSARQTLSQELQDTTGKNLEQTLAASKMSEPSRRIATIYAKNGNNLSSEQIREVADIALNSKVSGEQKLLMVKEAFSGDSDSVKQARAQFMGTSGEGEARLQQVFGNNDQFKQALDYAKTGRLDTATFIDLQRSNIADNDKGVELVLRMMTPEQRGMFESGQRLVQSGKTEGADAKETESLKYYQRVHEALGRASERITSPSRWFESNRQRVVTNWEDIAAHGEQTLIGRVASAAGRLNVIDAITNFTERDQTLMKDPAYSKQVWDMLGGPPGTDNSTAYSRTIFSGIEAEAGREQLAKIFPGNLPPEASVAARRPTLAEASEDAIRFDRQEPFVPRGQSFTFDALMHAKPEDYAALSGEQRRMLNARTEILPSGAREVAKEMLAKLKAGQDVLPGPVEQVFLASLNKTSRQSIAESILKQPEQMRQNPGMEKAAKFAFGEDFDKYGKSVLEGRGINAENLLAMNTQKGLFWNTIDQASYFDGMKLIPKDQREQILSASERARSNDPEAKKFLEKTFQGLSPEQREVALAVLRNPNQEFTLADQIRAKSLGASIDEQRLIDGFAKLSPKDRLGQLNDYAGRYNRFLVDDLSKNADENQRRQVELSLPMSRGDLERSFRDAVRDSGRGLYGHTAAAEISIGETQNRFQSQLIDRLPPEKREQAAQDIDKAFQNYVQALKENGEAKDQYARDLSEKIMLAVTTAGGALPVGATLVRLALTTATAVVARGSSEHLIKGGLTQSDVTQAAILGVVDGASLGRASAFKGIFEKSVAGAVEAHLGADATKSLIRSVDDGFQHYLRSGERGRLALEDQLTTQLRKRGVAEPEAATAAIISSFKRDSLPIKLNEAFAEIPGSKETIQELYKFGRRDALQTAVDRGLLTNEQMNSITRMVHGTVSNFAENPAIREQALNDVKWVTDNLRFITEKATNPTQAKTYADVLLMAARNRNVTIPMEALRSAEPQTLAFYRDQMKGAVEHFKAPGVDSVAGTRYEYAMQREIMDAIATSSNPKLREWVFIPGAKGSTADHAGLDGALVNIKDGRILPVDLKNYDIGEQTRWATHIEGRDPGINFNNRSLYNERSGRLVDSAKPRPGAVEEHLLRLTQDPQFSAWAIKPGTFAELNPSSTIHFPSLGDTPAAGDLEAIKAQVARMKEFISQADNGVGNGNTSLLRQRLQSSQNGSGGLRFVEQEARRLEAEQIARVANENVAKLRTVDPSVTDVEAKGIMSLRQQLSSANPGLELPTDRSLIAAQRSFDRMGVSPSNADLAALRAAKTPEDIERVVTDSVIRKMSDVVEGLAKSQKADDVRLARWTELFRNPQTGEIDREMLREIAKDPGESSQLREILSQLHKQLGAKQRQEIIDRAVDRIAVM